MNDKKICDACDGTGREEQDDGTDKDCFPCKGTGYVLLSEAEAQEEVELQRADYLREMENPDER